MPSSTAAVLGTYELLEMILLHVPPRQVFVVQRVTWQDMISTSKTIRQLCFLEPNGAPIEPRDDYKTTLADKRTVYPEAAFKINDLLVHDRWAARYRDGGSLDFNTIFKPPKPVAKQSRTKSSYSHLFLTQPPCTSVPVEMKGTSRKGFFLNEKEIYSNAAGVRMGEIEDWVAAFDLFQQQEGTITARITEHKPARVWEREPESEEDENGDEEDEEQE